METMRSILRVSKFFGRPLNKHRLKQTNLAYAHRQGEEVTYASGLKTVR